MNALNLYAGTSHRWFPKPLVVSEGDQFVVFHEDNRSYDSR
jgi:hypothetical protein